MKKNLDLAAKTIFKAIIFPTMNNILQRPSMMTELKKLGHIQSVSSLQFTVYYWFALFTTVLPH